MNTYAIGVKARTIENSAISYSKFGVFLRNLLLLKYA